jgi:hypothetical protein
VPGHFPDRWRNFRRPKRGRRSNLPIFSPRYLKLTRLIGLNHSHDDPRAALASSLDRLRHNLPANKIHVLQISDALLMNPPLPSEQNGTPARGNWSHAFRPLPYAGGYLPVAEIAHAVLRTGFRGKLCGWDELSHHIYAISQGGFPRRSSWRKIKLKKIQKSQHVGRRTERVPMKNYSRRFETSKHIYNSHLYRCENYHNPLLTLALDGSSRVYSTWPRVMGLTADIARDAEGISRR